MMTRRMPHLRLLFLAFAGVSLATVLTASAQGADTLVLSNGSQLKGVKVSKETYKEVVFAGQGLRQTYSYNRIRDIQHGDEPFDYKRAIQEMRSENHEEAIVHFQKASANSRTRPWVQQYSAFYIARCYQVLLEAQKAVDAYQKLLKTHPDTIFLPEAYKHLAESYMELGGKANLDAALAAYGKLSEFGENWKLQKQIGESRILEQQEKLKEAARSYQGIINQTAGEDSLAAERARGYEGLGRCLLGLNQIGEARKKFHELKGQANGAKEPLAIAVAYNGLGDCLFYEKKYEDAALAYLRVNILYSSSEDQNAKALFQAAQCFDKMSRSKTLSKEEKHRLVSRYKGLYSEVKANYPTSVWGQKADRLMR